MDNLRKRIILSFQPFTFLLKIPLDLAKRKIYFQQNFSDLSNTWISNKRMAYGSNSVQSKRSLGIFKALAITGDSVDSSSLSSFFFPYAFIPQLKYYHRWFREDGKVHLNGFCQWPLYHPKRRFSGMSHSYRRLRTTRQEMGLSSVFSLRLQGLLRDLWFSFCFLQQRQLWVWVQHMDLSKGWKCEDLVFGLGLLLLKTCHCLGWIVINVYLINHREACSYFVPFTKGSESTAQIMAKFYNNSHSRFSR